jgi:drug/metabolite transporter (DMT)-like permease
MRQLFSTKDDRHPLAGFFLVTASMLFLACIAAFARYATKQGLDPVQIFFFRNFFCVIWLLPLLAWRGTSLVTTTQPKRYGVRILFSYVSMMAMFQALELIPMAEVTAISFLSPIFGVMFAIFLLGEVVHARRWVALGVGFIGALIMLRPGVAELGVGQALALVSAMAIGIIGPLVKKLTEIDDPDRIVFITNLVMTPMSLVPALFVWQWPPAHLWLAMIGLGLAAVLGHMTLVRGYAVTDASLVMTYKFSRLPFAVIIGYFAFGEWIDLATWAGAAIIVAASVYISRREAQLKRETLVPPAPMP